MQKLIRVVDKEKNILQLTTVDERFYIKDSVNTKTGLPEYQYVPSVTWITSHYPKGIGFYKWLADKGWDEAEAIKIAAGNKGSKVHLAIADLLAGKTIAMEAKYLNKETDEEEELTPAEWECIMSFVEWYEETKPEVIAFEYVLWNGAENYAGTVDLKCKIDGQIWIIDLKTGADVWPEYELQVSAYKHAEPNPEEIAGIGILQLGYKRNKTKKWKFTPVADKFPLFLAAKQIWANETAGVQPLQKDYPLSLALPKPEQKVADQTEANA